jgi:hypothetical protein
VNRLKTLIIVAAVTTVAGTTLFAQELNLDQASALMRRNQEEIRNYTWATKQTFLIDGEQRRVDEYTVRYNSDGMLERMQTNAEVAKGKVRLPDGTKLKKKDLEVAKEFVLEVKGQLDGYLNPLFAEKAVRNAAVLEGDGTLLLLAKDVMTSGDTVEIILDEATKRPQTAMIKTTVEGSPVSLDVTFGSIEYGPNFPLKSVTKSQWRGLELTIVAENSAYKPNR